MEAEAKSALLKSQIDRAVVRAPFDWRNSRRRKSVRQGRYHRSKKAKRKWSSPNLDKLSVALTVNERDIQDVKKGSTGTLATTSKPTDKVGFIVDRIPPVGQPKEGSNVFTIYATPDKTNPTWRPGMAGEARIDVEKRTIAWIWSHRLMEFIRLKTWM